jgi:hypothetical protein
MTRVWPSHRALRRAATMALYCALALLSDRSAWADDEASLSDLFVQATKALHEGRAEDAVAAFESMADRGAVDATLSYDRGLAYATRVRIHAEQPGDLGRAAQGFEEARDLSHDPKLIDDASRALVVVRSEVARRRVLAGQSVEVDPGRSLGRVLAGLLDENTWAVFCVAFAFALTAGLFARWLGPSGRLRIAGGVAAGVAGPLLCLAAAMTLATRTDRLTLREAVIVSASARPTDERGVTIPGAQPVPEGGRVEVVDPHGAQTRVRFGTLDLWLPASALREIARVD